jgi:hypothetical protein
LRAHPYEVENLARHHDEDHGDLPGGGLGGHLIREGRLRRERARERKAKH